MPVSFLSPAQRDSYGQYLGDPSTQELARYFHLDDSDHTQIVEKRGDANRLGFALQLTTVRFVGTFLDDPTAVPPAVLATMSRQLGIDTTFGVSDLAAVLATCQRPRRRGRGVESDQVALERGRLDAVIAGLLFMAGMRRSEVSALRWADVVDSTDGDGMLVTVRRSKTNQEGEVNDVRFVKDGVGARPSDAARSHESGSPPTAWCRCRRR